MTQVIVGTLLILLGAYISLRPSKVAKQLQRFYSGYPLVRHAETHQLTSRIGYVVALGMAFIAVGALGVAVA